MPENKRSISNSRKAPLKENGHKQSKTKHIAFADDDVIASDFYSGDEAWRVDSSTSNQEILDRYVTFCVEANKKPLPVVIDILSNANQNLALTGLPAISFKGNTLSVSDIEALETIFKYCQAYLMSFERCKLHDESLSMLMDMLDFYAPCTELSLAYNTSLSNKSFKILSQYLAKYPYLTWLDLRGINIRMEDAQCLNKGLRNQFSTARSTFTQYLKQRDCSLILADEKPTQFGQPIPLHILRLYYNKSTPSKERKKTFEALCELPPLCLRGLHLGETNIAGRSLAEIGFGIRVAAHLSDLRLPSNNLNASSLESLTPLLRYYGGLRVLDLSNNGFGDEGCKVLGKALATPSYPSYCILPEDIDKTKGYIERLYLAKNDIGPIGINHLGLGLMICRNLSHLELSDNPKLENLGVLRAALLNLRHLKYLGLARCGVTCQGAIVLAEIIADAPSSLRRLDLSENYIEEAGLLSFSRSLSFATRLIHLEGLETNRPKPTAPPNSDKDSGGILQRVNKMIGSSNETTPPSSTSTKIEHSSLYLELLSSIHAQLAAHIDARASPKKKESSHKLSQETERFFRGYIRLPSMKNSQDPRHLIGDSSSEEESDEDSSKHRSGVENIPNPSGQADPPTKKETKKKLTKINSADELAAKLTSKRTLSPEEKKSKRRRSASENLVFTLPLKSDSIEQDTSSKLRSASTERQQKKSAKKGNKSQEGEEDTKSLRTSLKNRLKTKYPSKNTKPPSESDDEESVPQATVNAITQPAVRANDSDSRKINSLRKGRSKSLTTDILVTPDQLSALQNKTNEKETKDKKYLSLSKFISPRRRTYSSNETSSVNKASTNEKKRSEVSSLGSKVKGSSDKNPEVSNSASTTKDTSADLTSSEIFPQSRPRSGSLTSGRLSHSLSKPRSSQQATQDASDVSDL